MATVSFKRPSVCALGCGSGAVLGVPKNALLQQKNFKWSMHNVVNMSVISFTYFTHLSHLKTATMIKKFTSLFPSDFQSVFV